MSRRLRSDSSNSFDYLQAAVVLIRDGGESFDRRAKQLTTLAAVVERIVDQAELSQANQLKLLDLPPDSSVPGKAAVFRGRTGKF